MLPRPAPVSSNVIPIVREIRASLHMEPPEVAWWAGLTRLDRRFLLARAKLAPALCDETWQRLSPRERGAVLAESTGAARAFSNPYKALT
ncbi:MAG TPA: hypothetical protein VFX47_02905 [Gammaproteobacteria bacterium]|nr:hypothetical protein [Gammaproteobacteria bacterium]